MNDQNDQPAPEARRCAFFFDVDGTLAEIQPRPELVFIPPPTLAALERLHADGIPVAVISGRPLAQLDALLAPLQLPAAGVHGAERRDAEGELRNLALDARQLERIQRELAEACSEHPGLHLENKGVAFALHFRLAPQLEQVARELAEHFAERYAEVLSLQPGKCVFELKPRGASKGEVIRAFMEEVPFAGRTPVFVGDDLTVWDAAEPTTPRDFDLRHRQAFGDGTADTLSRLSIAIVGISGTGSPVCEMLARLGVGRLVLIDPDKIEPKNLNRIYGAKRADADAGRNKAEMARDRIQEMGLGTKVEIFTGRIDHPDAIRLLSTCDVLFGCMDSVVGRDTLNRTATFYLQPYFDIGVRLDADGEGGVDSVSAAVHYLKPGGSSLKSRGVYDDDQLYAEHLHDTDPEFYEDQRARGYVRGVAVDRPAVISINTAAAAFAVNELLARLHPFRTRPNAEFAIHKLLFSHGRTTCRPDGEPDDSLLPYVGRGDCRPLLMCGRLEIEV